MNDIIENETMSKSYYFIIDSCTHEKYAQDANEKWMQPVSTDNCTLILIAGYTQYYNYYCYYTQYYYYCLQIY